MDFFIRIKNTDPDLQNQDCPSKLKISFFMRFAVIFINSFVVFTVIAMDMKP